MHAATESELLIIEPDIFGIEGSREIYYKTISKVFHI